MEGGEREEPFAGEAGGGGGLIKCWKIRELGLTNMCDNFHYGRVVAEREWGGRGGS